MTSYRVLLAVCLPVLICTLVLQQFACGEDPAVDRPDSVVAEGAEAPADAPIAADESAGAAPVEVARPLIILAVGVAIVLIAIIVLKINAFLALITAAMAVSLLAVGLLGEGSWADSIARVAEAFGSSAGKIGIVIAMAAVIGKCMLDSGAADRIVRAFLALFGEKRSPVALMGSGFVLAVPVFFDTVFYLLVPLARSLHRRTGKHYLKYILAIAGGGAITHTLVPPTPGPLVMADTLGFDVGVMILVGIAVALPAAIAALVFAGIADRLMPVPMRPISNEPEPAPLKDSELPPLSLSLAPVVLPVLLISTNTILSSLVDQGYDHLVAAKNFSGIFGNANFALLLSTVIAMGLLYTQRKMSFGEMAKVVEVSLMSGGVIILITAGGGAFGAMLKTAQVGDAIRELFSGVGGSGVVMLLLGFGIAAVLKVAQGSSTVAMITGSAMLAGIASPETLGCHPVYLACAIGSGSLMGSWMNDSGFWIFAKMGGLTEVEALKSWTIMLAVLATVGLGMTVVLSIALPLAG